MRQENEGKIDSVTLYQDRACVARVTEVEFETGNHSLTMSSLPGGTMENSIRVRGHGSTPITLHKVNISTSVMASEPDEKVRDLESKTIDAAQEQKLIELKLDARKKQVEFVDKLAKAKTDSSSREIAAAAPASRISVEELGQIADFIYDRRVAAEQDQMALARDLEVARKKFQALQWELKKAKGDTGSRKRKTVTIDFSASEGGKASFTVEYMVSGASWRPLYNVRATAEGGDTQVSYMAMVRQVTGEDWSDVNLKLSTAMPSRGAKAPEVKPWDVDILKETPIHYLADGQAGGVARGMILGQAEELYESLDDSDVGMAAAATTVKSSGVST
ncbi:MAG: mucoidy inhibitor MuiA family protein, partial [Nitrospinota bacterium]|nr:mucoidy inhibitor MuiA family protein [Nitrospinota bacterium]